MKCKRCKRDIPDNSAYCNWCGAYQLKKIADEVTVPKPIQMPSGNWRIQLRRENISVVRGTPDACRKEAIRQRKLWLQDEADGKHAPPPAIVTLDDVISSYIKSRESTRSASTVDRYESIRKNRFKNYMNQDVNTLDTQQMIDDEIDSGVSAKTVRNSWGLCSSSLRYAKVPFDTPCLPRIIRAERPWLDYNQIMTFISAIRDSDYELQALLALHSLRRSEIYGLHPGDYDKQKQIIHVRGALLQTNTHGWVYTELNKNDTSRRDVPIIIDRLAELLNAIDLDAEYIIGRSRNNFYRAINRICRKADLPEVGVHGLRHSFASLAYHLGWKKLSTQQIGGWKNSKILDEIYTHNADLEDDLNRMREYFRE